MKKNPTIALLLASAMFAGVASADNTEAKAPVANQAKQQKIEKTPVDPAQLKKDIGYFLGYQNGRQMADIPTLTIEDIDVEAFMNGVKEGLRGDKPTKDQETVKASLDQFQKVIADRSAKAAEANIEKSKKFMEENAKKEGVQKTESGLQYKVINKGGDKKYDAKTNKNPLFSVKYKGTKLDGTVFDESTETVDFPLQVIPGFAEALKMMPIGAKWTVYIPAELGYGQNAPGGKIQPNDALIFDVELEGIKEAPAQPAGMGGGMNLSPEQLQQLMQQQQQGK
ncbi:MAG: FKBP-type peptidyl-prolyl cis-trans isomerase N-terminal domain-containing protein [Akkermansia sp.]